MTTDVPKGVRLLLQSGVELFKGGSPSNTTAMASTKKYF